MIRRVMGCAALAVLLAAAAAGCRSGAGPAARSGSASPEYLPGPACASRGPHPLETRLAWRSEEMPDGSVRMTVGDIDAAPPERRARWVADYRRPGNAADCDAVGIVRVHGWWCTTTVSPVSEHGEIVVGGAKPRARLRSAGFRTRCTGRPARMRQHFRIERDSWSGWRTYGRLGRTPWTSAQTQAGGPVTELCPLGRVGTYNYRLAVAVEVEGVRVSDSTAAGVRVRTDCGTGAS
jgi:hypothetical protein